MKTRSARLARTAAAWLQSGVAIPVAFGLALQVVPNASFRQGGAAAIGEICGGVSVSEAMQKAGILPDLTVQLLAAGEATGRVDDMPIRQAGLLEEASGRRISMLLAPLLPGLTIRLGLLVDKIIRKSPMHSIKGQQGSSSFLKKRTKNFCQ